MALSLYHNSRTERRVTVNPTQQLFMANSFHRINRQFDDSWEENFYVDTEKSGRDINFTTKRMHDTLKKLRDDHAFPYGHATARRMHLARDMASIEALMEEEKNAQDDGWLNRKDEMGSIVLKRVMQRVSQLDQECVIRARKLELKPKDGGETATGIAKELEPLIRSMFRGDVVSQFVSQQGCPRNANVHEFFSDSWFNAQRGDALITLLGRKSRKVNESNCSWMRTVKQSRFVQLPYASRYPTREEDPFSAMLLARGDALIARAKQAPVYSEDVIPLGKHWWWNDDVGVLKKDLPLYITIATADAHALISFAKTKLTDAATRAANGLVPWVACGDKAAVYEGKLHEAMHNEMHQLERLEKSVALLQESATKPTEEISCSRKEAAKQFELKNKRKPMWSLFHKLEKYAKKVQQPDLRRKLERLAEEMRISYDDDVWPTINATTGVLAQWTNVVHAAATQAALNVEAHRGGGEVLQSIGETIYGFEEAGKTTVRVLRHVRHAVEALCANRIAEKSPAAAKTTPRNPQLLALEALDERMRTVAAGRENKNDEGNENGDDNRQDSEREGEPETKGNVLPSQDIRKAGNLRRADIVRYFGGSEMIEAPAIGKGRGEGNRSGRGNGRGYYGRGGGRGSQRRGYRPFPIRDYSSDSSDRERNKKVKKARKQHEDDSTSSSSEEPSYIVKWRNKQKQRNNGKQRKPNIESDDTDPPDEEQPTSAMQAAQNVEAHGGGGKVFQEAHKLPAAKEKLDLSPSKAEDEEERNKAPKGVGYCAAHNDDSSEYYETDRGHNSDSSRMDLPPSERPDRRDRRSLTPELLTDYSSRHYSKRKSKQDSSDEDESRSNRHSSSHKGATLSRKDENSDEDSRKQRKAEKKERKERKQRKAEKKERKEREKREAREKRERSDQKPRKEREESEEREMQEQQQENAQQVDQVQQVDQAQLMDEKKEEHTEEDDDKEEEKAEILKEKPTPSGDELAEDNDKIVLANDLNTTQASASDSPSSSSGGFEVIGKDE